MADLPIKLDDVDHRLLLALLAEPTAPFGQIAEELSISAATVTSRYRRLQRHGLVRITGRTLPGFGGRHVYLVRATAAPDRIARLASSLARYDNTRWVRISTDGGELMCGLATDNPATDPILLRLPAEPSLRAVAIHELLHVWGGSGQAATSPAFHVDDVDAAILHHLAADGRTSVRSIAEQIGVNASTVSRHRQRLVDAGVLYFEADVHPDALGGRGDAMIWMSIGPGAIRAAGEALHRHPAVRFVAATSGRHQLVVHVQVIDNVALLEFVDEVLAPLGVAHAELAPMGRVLKRNAL